MPKVSNKKKIKTIGRKKTATTSKRNNKYMEHIERILPCVITNKEYYYSISYLTKVITGIDDTYIDYRFNINLLVRDLNNNVPLSYLEEDTYKIIANIFISTFNIIEESIYRKIKKLKCDKRIFIDGIEATDTQEQTLEETEKMAINYLNDISRFSIADKKDVHLYNLWDDYWQLVRMLSDLEFDKISTRYNVGKGIKLKDNYSEIHLDRDKKELRQKYRKALLDKFDSNKSINYICNTYFTSYEDIKNMYMWLLDKLIPYEEVYNKMDYIEKHLEKMTGIKLNKEEKKELIDMIDLRDGRNRLQTGIQVLAPYISNNFNYVLETNRDNKRSYWIIYKKAIV
ncbi:MAG: hypothetical protein ACRC1P_09885 [Cellulosilyticaceae bacterium]